MKYSHFRKLLEDADHSISTYKYPNITEFEELLDKVLIAAELGSIEHDKIENLQFDDEILTITTSWSARQCEQTSEFELPMFIVNSDDPILAATAWAKTQRIAKLHDKISRAEQSILDSQKSIEQMKLQLIKETIR